MPLVGTRDITRLAAGTALVERLDTEPWPLPQAEVFQALYELDEANLLSLLPRALHPTIPPMISFVFHKAVESSVGPFTLAEARVGCRSGARPRAFVARAFCDSIAAIELLRAHWGYPVEQAEVSLRHHYDRVFATVAKDGRTILDVALGDPEAIGQGDIQYIANMNLARIRKDGGEVVRLLQVDADYAVHRAERGRPLLETFDAAAWGVDGARPDWPISATWAVADVTLPKLRYMVDPEKPPLEALETI